MNKLLVALAFLALHTYVYYAFATDEIFPERESFESFPLQLGNWSCPGSESMGEKTEKLLGVTDYLLCEFTDSVDQAMIGVYVGYHETQIRRAGGEVSNFIHPPKHCIPGSGWDIIKTSIVDVSIPGMPAHPAQINRFIIAKGEARQMVYYWYQSRGRVIAKDWQKAVLMAWDRSASNRTDGSLVRFTISASDLSEEEADEKFLELASLLMPEVSAHVPEG